MYWVKCKNQSRSFSLLVKLVAGKCWSITGLNRYQNIIPQTLWEKVLNMLQVINKFCKQNLPGKFSFSFPSHSSFSLFLVVSWIYVVRKEVICCLHYSKVQNTIHINRSGNLIANILSIPIQHWRFCFIKSKTLLHQDLLVWIPKTLPIPLAIWFPRKSERKETKKDMVSLTATPLTKCTA